MATPTAGVLDNFSSVPFFKVLSADATVGPSGLSSWQGAEGSRVKRPTVLRRMAMLLRGAELRGRVKGPPRPQ